MQQVMILIKNTTMDIYDEEEDIDNNNNNLDNKSEKKNVEDVMENNNNKVHDDNEIVVITKIKKERKKKSQNDFDNNALVWHPSMTERQQLAYAMRMSSIVIEPSVLSTNNPSTPATVGIFFSFNISFLYLY